MDKFTGEKQSLLWGAVYFAKVWHGAECGEAVRAADAAAEKFAEREPSREEGEGRRRPR